VRLARSTSHPAKEGGDQERADCRGDRGWHFTPEIEEGQPTGQLQAERCQQQASGRPATAGQDGDEMGDGADDQRHDADGTNTRWVTAAGDASPKRSRTSAARKVATAERPR
jgi:hypothetical protein